MAATRRLLILGAALAGLLPVEARASEVAVGEARVAIVDSLARLEDWFGKPAIEVFLFARPLGDEQKRQIALRPHPQAADYDRLAAGNAPAAQILLFFAPGAKACSPQTLLSYTAVFEKSASFPFAVASDRPINWSFSKALGGSPASIGVTRLACSFDSGGEVSLAVKNEWLIEAGQALADKILPAGRSSLRFAWDVETRAKLIVPSEAKPAAGNALALKSDAVKDVAVSWVAKPHMLSLRLFKRPLSDAERKAAAGYPPEMPVNDFLGAVSVFYKDDPASLSGAKPDRATLSLVVAEGGGLRIWDYPIATPLEAAGDVALGAKVTLRSAGSAAGDARGGQPPATWDLTLAGTVQQVHR